MNGQRVIGITFVAILMLVAIILLIQAGRFLLGTNAPADEAADANADLTQVERTITDYIDSEAAAVFVRDGEINGTEDHNRVEFEITPSKREIRIIEGYAQQVETRRSFKNTRNAYEAFLNALAFEGILLQKDALYPSVDGVCPAGERFEFRLDSSGTDDDLYSWASSCSKRHGSFEGDRRDIQRLFEKQIPNYDDLTDGIRF